MDVCAHNAYVTFENDALCYFRAVLLKYAKAFRFFNFFRYTF